MQYLKLFFIFAEHNKQCNFKPYWANINQLPPSIALLYSEINVATICDLRSEVNTQDYILLMDLENPKRSTIALSLV